jgi:aspartate/methionine/tyrosine aminotransferase
MTSFADRIAHLEPEGAYKVLARAQELEREGRDIVHLQIGQPDSPTFDAICKRGKEAIDEGFTRYTPSAGIHELREAIAQRISADKGETTADEVVVGPGAKPGILFSMLALLNPGDEVIYPDPGFPSYRAAIELSGATPIAAPLLEDKNFSFDLDFLADRIGEKTKLLIINSPSNPTGGNASTEDLTAIARLAIERNVWVMTDEIYSDLVYDEKQAPSFFSIDEVRDRTILIDGFSKTFAMTGWRLGYAAMPKSLAEKVSLLTMHAVGCTAGFTQMAGITALKRCRENVAAQRATYQKRRDRIVEGLRSLPGVSCTTPQGAFYAFPNVSELGNPSKELAHRLMEEAGVAFLPGTDFGNNGEGYLRFSYAASIAQIEEAIDRIRGFISTM